MYKKILFLSLFNWSFHLAAAQVLQGNKDAPAGETFSFAVGQHVQNQASHLLGIAFYTAAAPGQGGVGAVNNFSLAMVNRASDQFEGLAPQTVTFNGVAAAPNPLYDAGISFLTLFNGQESILGGMQERPELVPSADLKTIYIINNILSTGTDRIIEQFTFHKLNIPTNEIIRSQNVPDATGAVTAGIVGLEAGGPFTFAAVQPASGTFGLAGSGIAVGVIGVAELAEGNSFTGPIIIDAPTGSIAYQTGNRATPLDVSSDVVAITNDAASMTDEVSLHLSLVVGRLYAGLSVVGGADGADGVRSVVCGKINQIIQKIKDDEGNEKEVSRLSPLTLFPIAPAAAITGTDKIIGAVGSNATVSAHHVQSMLTSTALAYLIVQGGVGPASSTRKTVFALPLVSGNADAALNGTIADKHAEPENLFAHEAAIPTHFFYGRVITTPATTAAQMPLSTDTETQVGAGALLNGDITQMYVYGDAVFVTVQHADAPQEPGVYYSQALFESNGKIKGWTIWKPAVGLPDKTQSVALDPFTGLYTTLVANSADQVTIVKRTQWASGDNAGLVPLAQTLDTQLPQSIGGVQGLQDFVMTSSIMETATPGLLDISLMIATGLNKVLLFQTSQQTSGAITPTLANQFGSLLFFANGTIDQSLPVGSSKQMMIEGGVLEELGPLSTCEIATNGAGGLQGWIFVGGTNGVAVLSQADGSGWDTATGLSNGFAGLTAGMSFKKVGNFSFVRTLMYDDNYLYVLTNTQLVRIDLTNNNPGLGDITADVIIDATSISGVPPLVFLDMLISEKIAVIATNNGVYRLSNGLDIRTVTQESADWSLLPTPEGAGPVRQLCAVTKTGRAQDLARTPQGGYFYALSADRSSNQAYLFRYAVESITGLPITDTTIQRIDDLFVEGINSYFANYGSFRVLMATDGALFYGTQNKVLDNDPFVSILFKQDGVKTGADFLLNKQAPITFDNGTLIAAMKQQSATGSWFVAGDYGVRINE